MPVAINDIISATENGGLVTGNLIANDTGDDVSSVLTVLFVDGQPLVGGEITITLPDGRGSITVFENGDYEFTPGPFWDSLAEGVVGGYNLSYTIFDSFSATGSASSLDFEITGVNDAPTATGLPSDVTVTEDVASNLDLSGVSLADVDAGGALVDAHLVASAGFLSAVSGGGVTVFNSGTGTLTLRGTVADIDAFLNSASAVQYTGASNANGDNAATVSLTVNDGFGSFGLGTVNVDITAVNDIPTATGLPTDVTVTEDVASNVDLSTVSLADVDSAGSITVFLAARPAP